MTEPTALGDAILIHWRTYRPRMVKELEKKKCLKEAVLEAEELTGDLLYELVSIRKMDHHSAWVLASREWAFLPEEELIPASPRPKRRTMKKSRNHRRRRRATSG